MTATDTIRALLDERGVEWIGTSYTNPTLGHPTYTNLDEEHNNAVLIEYFDGTVLRLFDLTPEQAVDAMLGRETCKFEYTLADNGWADHTCSECGYVENLDVHVSLGWHYCPSCGRKVKR